MYGATEQRCPKIYFFKPIAIMSKTGSKFTPTPDPELSVKEQAYLSNPNVLVSVSLRDMPAKPNTAPESLFGERSRYARNDLKLSVEALSRLTKDYDPEGTGLSPTSISRYESGESLPGIREFRILCESLDVPMTWLLYGDPTEPDDNPKLNQGERMVLLGLRMLVREGKDDHSVNMTEEMANDFKFSSRVEKLGRARKPIT
ncbi:transcriptional regulator with XRE-family HTH domain [Polaromonas sp. CG_9.7]|uniref:helix-turn-helix domain-containing protein n=1 Tax=Polaromonas sp. CG_9.7 TaxID=2787732 RepID=UPI0018CAE9E4|nr:helix-turn-helix transcriptional regulator [Polaromonas sp. CG_9.7]MBG6074008.1 transcriptional regulator with XRE-family HTH domain [Polaromonas sp. CG_9.7]MBG6116034.1 transcriptional regulator with XRE-family HTH domain [Polaromonas sp. CG_9.2]